MESRNSTDDLSKMVAATLSTVSRFISSEEEKKKLERKVSDSSAEELFVKTIQRVPSGSLKLEDFVPPSPKRGGSPLKQRFQQSYTRLGNQSSLSPKQQLFTPFDSGNKADLASAAATDVQPHDSNADPESIDRVMEWISFLKEQVDTLKAQNRSLQKKLEKVEQQAIEPVLALATATSVADQSDGSRLADDLAESRAQNVSIKIENRHLQREMASLREETCNLRKRKNELEDQNAYLDRRARLLEENLRSLLQQDGFSGTVQEAIKSSLPEADVVAASPNEAAVSFSNTADVARHLPFERSSIVETPKVDLEQAAFGTPIRYSV
mmetsp:Transcript_15217/g.29333  ORF Transcript_15217/g.29333 Transcript_15217/m.29333 type:complete len:325 (-) Transcript_15217:150-1124(-)